jgi:Ca2+-transporting ATPase
MKPYLVDVESVFNELKSKPAGLATGEAKSRLQQHGPNELVEKKKRPAWLMFLLQFKDVMILILIAAAIISGAAGDLKDTIVILAIVVINAVIGFVQEYRAEKAMEALKKMATASARVLRDNQRAEIPLAELVPGDVVLLEAGDVVPADLRLTEIHTLKIDEASLTGESQAVDKTTEPINAEKTSLGDRVNMAFKHTLVTHGRGTGVVVSTGMETEIGKIAAMLQQDDTVTPLQKRMADFGKKLSVVVLIICAVLFFLGWMRGEDPLLMLLTSISVAVAAIPEALPAVITISLAQGAKRLVQQHALVRKLPAVETLGSVTFICTDKTGTLTQNKMTVRKTWQPEKFSAEGLPFSAEELLVFAMAANQDTREEDSQQRGDPTEIALVQHARNHDAYQEQWLEQYPRVEEIPFDSQRKLMTTIHKLDGEQHLALTKGAVESILSICASADCDVIQKKSDELAAAGQRVLAYSYRANQGAPAGDVNNWETEQRFLGLVGMIDPPREEAKAAVAECQSAGIVPVMITGDHPITARVIAKELGILKSDSDKVLTAQQLEELSPSDFEQQIEQIKVYARVSPAQKLQIIETLQKKHQFVAMTGDGVNDAPALKKADIGVAMGITGTDVSKEASDMILLDDNFATIVNAVREGRRIYDNIRKFIRYAMTGNSGELWTIFLAPLFGLPIPLLPIHILWINLVTDGLPGLALASEPAEDQIMQRPPRPPKENIFAHGLGWHIVWVGLLIGGLCVGVQWWALTYDAGHAQTMVFTTLCFCQLAHVLAIRSETSFLFRLGLFSNKMLLGAVAFTSALQLALIYVPALRSLFSLELLTWQELLICLGVASVIFHAVELEKFVRRRFMS